MPSLETGTLNFHSTKSPKGWKQAAAVAAIWPVAESQAPKPNTMYQQKCVRLGQKSRENCGGPLTPENESATRWNL